MAEVQCALIQQELDAQTLGVDPFSEEGVRAVQEFQTARAQGRISALVNNALDTVQLLADLPGAALENISDQRLDFGSIDRNNARLDGLVQLISSPIDTISSALDQTQANFERAIAESRFADAGQIAGSFETNAGLTIGTLPVAGTRSLIALGDAASELGRRGSNVAHRVVEAGADTGILPLTPIIPGSPRSQIGAINPDGVSLADSLPIVNPGRRVAFDPNTNRFRDLSTGRFVAAADVTPSDLARGFQGSPGFPGVDRFRDVTLREGQLIVAGEPGLSGFFTTLQGLRRSNNDAPALFNGLQVPPRTSSNGVTSFRPNAGIFEVLREQPAAVGIARAQSSSDFGVGGFPQAFLPEVQARVRQLRDAGLSENAIVTALESEGIVRRVGSVNLSNFVVE